MTASTDVWDEVEEDPLTWAVNAMPDEEFLRQLSEALVKDLEPSDFETYSCFWGEPAV